MHLLSVRRRGLTAVVLAAFVAVALPATATAGDPIITLNVAKQRGGPYNGGQEANIKLNQMKQFFWKARNVTEAKVPGVVLADDTEYPPGWVKRWYRGKKNISSDVKGDGYEFALKAGASKVFRSTLKPTKAVGPLCHEAYAGPDKIHLDYAFVFVNDPICLI